jgi:hypothetical protein
MNAINGFCRIRAAWTPLVALGVAAMMPALPAQAQEKPIGTVMAVPLGDYGRFLAANAFPGLDSNNRPIQGNNANFLHLSQFAAGSFNTTIATVGVTQRNTGQPAQQVYVPTGGTGQIPQIYRQLNVNDTFLQQQVIGVGNTAVAQVTVNQENSGTYVPGMTRFFLAPADQLAPIRGANVGVNINNAHVQQTAIGANNTTVALLAVDQQNANNLALPGAALVNAVTNVNTNVVVQTVVGEGNTAVATIGVNQQNAPGG